MCTSKEEKPILLDEMLTILGWLANRFAGRSDGRYEANELINEAWLVENVRNACTRQRMFMAARWAMIAYMQREQKIHHKSPPRIRALSSDFDIPIYQSSELDYLDELNAFINRFSKENQAIIKLRLEGLEWKQIARCIGEITKQAVQVRFSSCMAKIRIAWIIYSRK